MSLYSPPPNKYSDKGRSYFLIGKRNKQLASVLRKITDPTVILRFYIEMGKIYRKFFPNERSSEDQFVEILIWASERNSFFFDDLEKHFGLNIYDSQNMILRLTQRHLINVSRQGKPFLYYLSPDGRLFLDKFSKEIAGLVVKFAKK